MYLLVAGAFFIAYILMLVFCGMPLVYMEMAFGQYGSLGPITVWRAVPLFKGRLSHKKYFHIPSVL